MTSSTKYKYGILMCCYNRPEILKKTLESLKKTNKEDLNQSIRSLNEINYSNLRW